MLSRDGVVAFDSLQLVKVTNNRIVILAVATMWDVLLDVFCSCVQDFRVLVLTATTYICSVFGF